MFNVLSKMTFYTGSVIACLMMVFTTSCASGGFKLTRRYSQFVNSNHIVLRVILYIFTAVVFAITMLIDLVYFNTMDFWEGRVSANTYEFEKDNKKFFVKHEISPETKLKKSTIEVKDFNQKLLQTVVLKETEKEEIELYVDGVLRTKVDNIHSLPRLTSFDKSGKLLEKKYIDLNNTAVATK